MQDKILYQFVMNYRAYRRKMLAVRVTVSAVLVAASVFFYLILWALGIIVPVSLACICTVWVLVGLHGEGTYTVYADRAVVKYNGKRLSVEFCDLISVGYKRGFYEKDLATGTVTITALDEYGKKKTYRMKHIFNCAECVELLKAEAEKAAEARKNGVGENAEAGENVSAQAVENTQAGENVGDQATAEDTPNIGGGEGAESAQSEGAADADSAEGAAQKSE